MDKNYYLLSSFDDTEDWECDFKFIEDKDYEGLIKYRKKCLKRYPNDSDTKWRLGEALVLNQEYEKALDYFKTIYKEEYDNINIQYSILDCIYALGKEDDDFEWIEKPEIVTKKEAVEKCYEYLKNKRKRHSIDELYISLMIDGYLPFKEKELEDLLKEDKRFTIEEGKPIYEETVKVVKNNAS
ncbi:MAG: tetratricopeptide repeat protein [Firmicutes bacterium]|nr:tetratricopeptide repeat protein [Bacillota bacterium]